MASNLGRFPRSRPPCHIHSVPPSLERLEERAAASSLLALAPNRQLLRFRADDPATVLSSTPITGVSGELVDIDFRPGTGQLYGIALEEQFISIRAGRVYAINPFTGAATRSVGFSVPKIEQNVTFDFDPLADLARLVSASRAIFLPPGSPPRSLAHAVAFSAGGSFTDVLPERADTIADLAYGSSRDGAPYAITFTGDLLRINGLSDQPAAVPPSYTLVAQVGPGQVNSGGFDVDVATGTFYASLDSSGRNHLFAIDPASGQGIDLGAIDANAGAPLTAGLAAIPEWRVATGSDIAGDVRLYDGTGRPVAILQPFGNVLSATDVALGDLTGDGSPDLLCASGATVRVFDGRTLGEIRGLAPFTGLTGFTGIEVASGDVNADGTDDIVVATGIGTAGQVNGRVEVYDGQTAALLGDFEPFVNFQGGLHIGTVDEDGDGRDEVLVGSGLQVSPLGNVPYAHVTTFELNDGSFILTRSFQAFIGYGGGINVAGGDVNGDGHGDILISSNLAAAHVVIFSGAANAGQIDPGPPLHSFLVFSPAKPGIRATLADADEDGAMEVLITPVFTGTPAGSAVASQVLVVQMPADGSGLFSLNAPALASRPLYDAPIGAAIASGAF